MITCYYNNINTKYFIFYIIKIPSINIMTEEVVFMKNFEAGLKESLSFKRNVDEIRTLQTSTKIMMFIMLIAEIIAFVFGQDFGFTGWIGLITGIATVMNLILVDQARLTNYSWGILSCTVWLLIALNNRLIGDICSQTFYLVMQFVGISIWHRDMSKQTDSEELEPKKLGWKKGILIAVGIAVLYFVVLATSKAVNGSQVYLDATLLPLGIAGQILMTYGMRSQWIIWIINDVINVMIWGIQLHNGGAGAITMFILQIIMLINAFYGLYMWFKPRKDDK